MTERNGYRGYNTSRPFLGERVPQHIQNMAIREYALQNNLHFLLSATEYVMPGCMMMLEQVVSEMATFDGMICYSIFQLPESAESRRGIYSRILQSSGELHSALEGYIIRSTDDIQQIEDLWKVRQLMPLCPSASDVAASI